MKRIIKLLVCITMVFSLLLNMEVTHAQNYSGTCGPNLTWTLDPSTGLLNINGSGPMTDNSFSSYSSQIKEVHMSDEVTSIPDSAFSRFTSLISIRISDNVSYIGSSAFSGCSSLKEITIPDSVGYIGSSAFSNCDSLTEVAIPDNVTTLESWAFEECDSLKKVTIGSGIKKIQAFTFNSCYALTDVNIGKNVTDIAAFAFEYCGSLKTITFPESVKSIGAWTFEYCSSLTDIYILNGSASLNSYTFEGDPIKLTIHSKKGGSVQSFAENNNINFKEIGTDDCINHNFKSTIVSPTTTTRGYTLHTCTKCGYSYKDNYTNPIQVNTELTFPDVSESKWYYSVVKEAYSLGLMTGKADGTFDPTGNMTRGQVAVVLWRMAGSPAVAYDGHFTDVPDNKYYSVAITWAYQNGIVKGKTSTTFDPTANITRQELAIMLKRYTQSCGVDVSQSAYLDGFADASKVSAYAIESVQWAVANEIIGGKTRNGKLYIDPKANATRAECCKMLLKTYHLING